MRIVELEAQPNCVLSIVADDGRIGRFDVSPFFGMRRSKHYETRLSL